MVYSNKFLHSILNPSRSNSTGEGNIYEETNICAKRARQIVEQRRVEFDLELESMNIPQELVHEPASGMTDAKAWRETLAEEYEKKPAPFATAQAEYRAGALVYTYHDEDPMLGMVQADIQSI